MKLCGTIKSSVNILLFAILSTSPLVHAERQITVVNDCEGTVWPLIWEEGFIPGALRGKATGWEAAPKTSKLVQVPNVLMGFIWGRQGCLPVEGPAGLKCAAGDCQRSDDEGPQCTLLPVPNNFTATVALLTFGQGSEDVYDVTLGHGFNLPMSIQTNTDCPELGCSTDFVSSCPNILHGNGTADGPLTCRTSCQAEIGNVTQLLRNCCSDDDAQNTGKCNNAGTQYYKWYQSGCPSAALRLADEGSNRCLASKKAKYTITFCPLTLNYTIRSNTVSIEVPHDEFASASTFTRSTTLSTLSGKSTNALSVTLNPSSTSTHEATTSSTDTAGLSGVDSGRLRGGSTVGIIVGALLFCTAIAIAVFLIRRQRHIHALPSAPLKFEEPMAQFGDPPSSAPAVAFIPNHPERSLAQRHPSSGKRALVSPVVSRVGPDPPATSSRDAGSPTISSPAAGRPEPEQDFEERFEERFQTQLMEFLYEHANPPPANHGSEAGDSELPAYPGTRL